MTVDMSRPRVTYAVYTAILLKPQYITSQEYLRLMLHCCYCPGQYSSAVTLASLCDETIQSSPCDHDTSLSVWVPLDCSCMLLRAIREVKLLQHNL